MEDETTAPPTETTQHVPHDLVINILLHLPVDSLMRFACVSRTWHDTITDDRRFRSEHHRLQEPCLLIAPRVRSSGEGGGAALRTTTTCLYRWERKSQADTATLVQAVDPFPAVEEAWRHTLAHCHGLVLVPTDDGPVRVLNPAMRGVLALPLIEESHLFMARRSWMFLGAFGFGPDHRSDTYKVVRIFYRYAAKHATNRLGYTLGMDVLSIGRDRQWRETAAPPPCPVVGGQTATLFRDSLLWKIDEDLTTVVRGFLRFNLEDESFTVMPGPPGCPQLKHSTSNLAAIRGELCLAHRTNQKAFIWACDGAEPPQWVLRHTIDAAGRIRLIPTPSDEDHDVVFQGPPETLQCFDSRYGEDAISMASMDHLSYHHPDTDTLVRYAGEAVDGYDVVPYVPSLVAI